MSANVVISVVIPCYNHGKYLQDAINSVEENKGAYSVEIIIVNDGSTDEQTLKVFELIESEGYFVLHQENQGLAMARNNGIQLAKGKYIIPLDSDNKLTKEYLSTAIELMEKDKSIDIIYGDAEYFGEKSGLWKNQPFNIEKMLFSNHIDACAVYRKNVWEKIDGYSHDMPYMGCEDWNFWLKAYARDKKFFYLDEVCFNYRVLSNSMIRNVEDDFRENIFIYNTSTLALFYQNELRKIRNKDEAIFGGGFFKKVIKMILNHFNLYDYNKR